MNKPEEPKNVVISSGPIWVRNLLIAGVILDGVAFIALILLRAWLGNP